MDRKRKLRMIAISLVVAAASGQYMQSGNSDRLRNLETQAVIVAGSPMSPIPVSITPLSSLTPRKLPELPDTPFLPQIALAALSVPQDPAPIKLPLAEETPPSFGGACVSSLTVDVGPSAMLLMHLKAPCAADQSVVVSESGLMFTAIADKDGVLELDVPAMAENSRLQVQLSAGETLSAMAEVPELALFNRVAVQWAATDAFGLHALEFGANFGQPGDVSAGNPGTPSNAMMAKGGFLTKLGAGEGPSALFAEVYTFPTGLSTKAGAVKLVIEAPITKATCGREMSAKTLQTKGKAAPAMDGLTMTMPACDAANIGQFVELPDVLPEVVVAAK